MQTPPGDHVEPTKDGGAARAVSYLAPDDDQEFRLAASKLVDSDDDTDDCHGFVASSPRAAAAADESPNGSPIKNNTPLRSQYVQPGYPQGSAGTNGRGRSPRRPESDDHGDTVLSGLDGDSYIGVSMRKSNPYVSEKMVGRIASSGSAPTSPVALNDSYLSVLGAADDDDVDDEPSILPGAVIDEHSV